MKQITTEADILAKKNVIGRIADVPGGMSLTIADLPVGTVVEEATPVTAPSSGKRTVCKAAKILTGSTTTVIKVASATNPFKVGDFLTAKVGGKAYAITEIAVASGVASLTVGTAIDADVDGWVYEAAAGTTTYTADATLNIAYDNDTCAGLTADATSETLATPTGIQGTVATIVGTISSTGNATVTVSSDALATDVVVSVGVLDTDTADIVAEKIRAELHATAAIVAVFDVVGDDTQVGLVRTLTAVTGGSVFKNQPDVILLEAFVVPSNPMVIVMADALVFATVRSGSIAPAYLSQLPTVKEIKY